MAKSDKNKSNNNKNNNNKNTSSKKKEYKLEDYLKLSKKDQQKYLKNLTTANRKKLLAEVKKKEEQDKKNKAKLEANQKITIAVDNEGYSITTQKAGAILSNIDALYGIEGIPYQFNEVVDPRFNGSKIGRKYAEKIYSRMPLVFLTPCDRVFMDEFSAEDRSNVINALATNVENFSEDLVSENGQYFSVKYAHTEYYNYLNPMMVAMASFLNIADMQIDIGKGEQKAIKSIDWSGEANEGFQKYFSAKENLVFYANEMNNISESFSNDTMESSLAGTLNGFSDQAKELRFLINGGVGQTLMESATDAVSSITKSLSDVTGKLGGGLIGSVTKNGINTIVNGGKILFPKIWSDSSHNTSYSINFKFRSPDNDTLSIFLNILKPYAKLLALVMPKVDESDVNGYNTPHLVKATCPGFFHIDMGLITSMSVSKGEEGQWNDDGLPTVLDVSIEIEDLYNSVLYMTGYHFGEDTINPLSIVKDPFKFVSNTAYMDFLANTCGVNIHTRKFDRMAKAVQALLQNSAVTIPSRVTTKFDQIVANVIGNAWKRIGV